jgi:S-ribosylhomocysteine lyase
MKRIASFSVDHTRLSPGLYLSRTDGGAQTYDLRTRRPNTGSLMDNATMHSVEHLFATFARNSALSESVLYFGPMGCQTGFYLIMRDTPRATVIQLVKDTLLEILNYGGPMPGASAAECGNYRNLSVEAAKTECRAYYEAIRNIGAENLVY